MPYIPMTDEHFTYRYYLIDNAIVFRVLIDSQGRERGAQAPDRASKQLIYAHTLLSRKFWSSWVDEIDETRFDALCAEIYARPAPEPIPEFPPDPNEVIFHQHNAPYDARTVSFRIDHNGDALLCDEGTVDWYIIVRKPNVPALHAALKTACARDALLPDLIRQRFHAPEHRKATDLFRAYTAFLNDYGIPSEFQRW